MVSREMPPARERRGFIFVVETEAPQQSVLPHTGPPMPSMAPMAPMAPMASTIPPSHYVQATTQPAYARPPPQPQQQPPHASIPMPLASQPTPQAPVTSLARSCRGGDPHACMRVCVCVFGVSTAAAVIHTLSRADCTEASKSSSAGQIPGDAAERD
jgi:hypothetical protein